MKIRVGYGLGNLRSLDGVRLGALAEAIESRGFDSLWLSERISGPSPDPMLGLTFAAARTERIKLGTSVQVLPGRSPARLAKSWATLDALSGGRVAIGRRSSTRRSPSSADCGRRMPSTTTGRTSTTRR